MGKRYWYAQWRENGKARSKEVGLCSELSKGEAEAVLAEILQSVNAGISQGRGQAYTFEEFVNRVYLPVWRGKWKVSTAMTEEARVHVHLIPPLGPDLMQEISRERLQRLLKQKTLSLSQSGVDHLRFRLRSIFELAVCEFAVDRNPATTLFTPKDCQPDKDRRMMTIEQAQQMIRALGPRGGSTSTIWTRRKRSGRCAKWALPRARFPH